MIIKVSITFSETNTNALGSIPFVEWSDRFTTQNEKVRHLWVEQILSSVLYR